MKAQIYLLFHGKHRIRADMLCFFYLFNHILNISIYSFQKFIAIVIGSWSSASNLQMLLYQMLRKLMPCCTFSSIRTFFIRELFLQQRAGGQFIYRCPLDGEYFACFPITAPPPFSLIRHTVLLVLKITYPHRTLSITV